MPSKKGVTKTTINTKLVFDDDHHQKMVVMKNAKLPTQQKKRQRKNGVVAATTTTPLNSPIPIIVTPPLPTVEEITTTTTLPIPPPPLQMTTIDDETTTATDLLLSDDNAIDFQLTTSAKGNNGAVDMKLFDEFMKNFSVDDDVQKQHWKSFDEKPTTMTEKNNIDDDKSKRENPLFHTNVETDQFVSTVGRGNEIRRPVEESEQ